MFSKILIANRGEIAVRIIRACKEMGIVTVAVYSSADAESLHVAMADRAVCIGPAPAAESYLRQDRILAAALATGAEAIHPGYGFLAENAEFAALCRKHGVAFIGPSPELIAAMGDKDSARRTMQAAGVPVIPGSGILKDPAEARLAAEALGYPVLLKASSGGGGKGIRRVDRPEELERAFQTASAEAEKAFGDGRMYLEKCIAPARHIEVQLLADERGNTVCLGERECSLQKNKQKLLEESPSPAVSAELRQRLFDTAVRAARAVGYTNAGTVEFLLDDGGNFYFMEMNTRLQVEHPVTEQVTGVDLVKWQIRIAAGVLLDFTQQDVELRGAAIECRINARGTGTVELLLAPSGPNVRFDSFLYQGYTVPPYYDAMLGKLIVASSTREEAIRKMQSALCELLLTGVPTNVEEQLSLLREDAFRSGNYDTNFAESRGE